MAWGFNAALLVKIIPFSELLEEFDNNDLERFYAASIGDEDEAEKLNNWIEEK